MTHAPPTLPQRSRRHGGSPCRWLALALAATSPLRVQAQAPPPPSSVSGLAAWYRADMLANVAVDRSGNGRTGTVQSQTGLAAASDPPGTAGISATCPASVQYVSLAP